MLTHEYVVYQLVSGEWRPLTKITEFSPRTARLRVQRQYPSIPLCKLRAERDKGERIAQ